MTYKGISLFSGCGGLDLGFERVDDYLYENETGIFKTVWANDIDEKAVETYSSNFDFEIYQDPDIVLRKGDKKIFLGDVKNINFQEVINDNIDYILGGFPCQDFSILGGNKRQGIEVKRGELYLQFVRSLIELQPYFFVAENVKGLKSANDGVAFNQIKSDFQHLNENLDELADKINIDLNKINEINNYEIVFDKVVNFANYGVAQNRERLIIIGVRSDLVDKNNLIRIIDKLKSFLLPEKYLPITPIEIFEGKELSELNSKYVDIMHSYDSYLKGMNHDVAKEYINKTWENYEFNIIEDYFNINDLEKNKIIEVNREIIRTLKELDYYNKPVDKQVYEDGSNKKASSIERIKERMRRIPPGENHKFVKDTKHSVKAMMSNIYRRVHPLIPSPTIIANGGGGTYGYHYEIERQNLTNRERARLQSFPDNFMFKGNKSDVRRQIGNSVPPLGSKKIALAIKKYVLKELKIIKNHSKTEAV